MSTTPSGGAAFPSKYTVARGSFDPNKNRVATNDEMYIQMGMSLRDYFAGQALGCMTVSPDYSKGPCNAEIAERAYIIADRMLAAREAKP